MDINKLKEQLKDTEQMAAVGRLRLIRAEEAKLKNALREAMQVMMRANIFNPAEVAACHVAIGHIGADLLQLSQVEIDDA